MDHFPPNNLKDSKSGHNSTNPVVIAIRGLPLSGKSTVARSLFVILKKLGFSPVWINQDELGNRKRYIGAVKHAYEQSATKYTILDKTNRAAENLLDIVEICGRIDYFFNFVHPEDRPDEDGAGQCAIQQCKSRFADRQDGHRSIGKDDNIEKILNAMASMSVNSQNLLRYAVILNDIDMTYSSDRTVQQILSVISVPVTDDQLVKQSIVVSRQYEKCLLQLNGQRYISFGVLSDHDINQLLNECGDEVKQFCITHCRNKTKLQSHHVTVAYFGDLIDPDL
ncbi:hypothetical protein MP228_007639 [Amoeboaphelidium protococcarum]|nr:hypothetical protein MP228_007639 [Amoeboaphelidium protococcarum]